MYADGANYQDPPDPYPYESPNSQAAYDAWAMRVGAATEAMLQTHFDLWEVEQEMWWSDGCRNRCLGGIHDR